MSLHVGSRFESYDSLENAVKEYERKNNITLWKRESRTIMSMSRRIERINPENTDTLKFYSIKYACIFGGRKHKKRITTGTRSSKTFRQDCPAHIKVLLSPDQKFLEITAINEDHNHDISEELNNTLKKQRKLADEKKHDVSKLMSLQELPSEALSELETDGERSSIPQFHKQHLQSRQQKRKYDARLEISTNLKSVSNILSNTSTKDDLDVFGRYVSAILKKLKPNLAVKAKTEIMEVCSKYELLNLKPSEVLIFPLSIEQNKSAS